MTLPASHLAKTLKLFESQCGDHVQAAVAFAAYLVTQRNSLDKILISGDQSEIDEDSLNVYLISATQVLDEYKDQSIREFVPNFERELRSKQIDDLRSRFDERTKQIEAHVTQRTDLKSAIFANLAAWAVSIMITAAVIALFFLPGIEDSLVARIKDATEPP